jgi:hypothetical protein
MLSQIGTGGRISSGATLECYFAKKSAASDHNRRKPPHFIWIAQYICFACGFVRFEAPIPNRLKKMEKYSSYHISRGEKMSFGRHKLSSE